MDEKSDPELSSQYQRLPLNHDEVVKELIAKLEEEEEGEGRTDGGGCLVSTQDDTVLHVHVNRDSEIQLEGTKDQRVGRIVTDSGDDDDNQIAHMFEAGSRPTTVEEVLPHEDNEPTLSAKPVIVRIILHHSRSTMSVCVLYLLLCVHMY